MMIPTLIRKIRLFESLTDKEMAALAPCLREKSFQKNAGIFSEESRCERVFFVVSGRIKLYRLTPGGREQSLQVLEAGDTCACNPGATSWNCSSSAKALSDCHVLFLATEDYARLVRDMPELAKSLNRVLAEKLQCLSGLVEDVSLKDSQKRLAKFLSDNAPTVVLSREEIASRLGMARETLARQLHALKRKGLISVEPKKIRILDLSALKAL